MDKSAQSKVARNRVLGFTWTTPPVPSHSEIQNSRRNQYVDILRASAIFSAPYTLAASGNKFLGRVEKYGKVLGKRKREEEKNEGRERGE